MTTGRPIPHSFRDTLIPIKRKLESARRAAKKGRITQAQLSEIQKLKDAAYNSSSKKEILRIAEELDNLPFFPKRKGVGYTPRNVEAAKEFGINIDETRFNSDRDYRIAIQKKIAWEKQKPRRQKKDKVAYSYEEELIDFRKRGLSIDSPEVQKFIDKRATDGLHNIRSKSNVYSYATVNGLPDGEIIPESKKLVARLFNDLDKEEIRSLVRGVVADQSKEFFRTGVIPTVDEIDHIFPGGNPRIINGKLVGGAVSEAGDFLGVGLTNSRNLQALARELNASQRNILNPGKIATLPLENPAGSISVQKSLANPTTPEDTLARIQQEGAYQRGETNKRPVRRFGGTALSLLAGLPLWFLSDDSYAKMVDKGEENISSTADKILPQGLVDYAKNIGSKVDNYIGKTFDPRTIPEVHASIGQYLLGGLKQLPSEAVGSAMLLKDIHNKSLKAPEENLSWAERMRRLQSGRSY